MSAPLQAPPGGGAENTEDCSQGSSWARDKPVKASPGPDLQLNCSFLGRERPFGPFLPGARAQASGTGGIGWSWLLRRETVNERVSVLAGVYLNQLPC